jgi:hypothetical protein
MFVCARHRRRARIHGNMTTHAIMNRDAGQAA